MRMLSLDIRMTGNRFASFDVWNGIAAPEGHIKLSLKVTLPPKKGMIGESKHYHENIKWNGSRKELRKNILTFLIRNIDKDLDIQDAMSQIKDLFI